MSQLRLVRAIHAPPADRVSSEMPKITEPKGEIAELCKNHELVMAELRRNILLSDKLKIISNSISFDHGAHVRIVFDGDVINTDRGAEIGGGIYVFSISYGWKQGVIQVCTNEVSDPSRLFMGLSGLLDHAGIRDVKIIQATGYDPEKGMHSRQTFDDAAREHIINEREADRKEHCCYAISVKFDCPNDVEVDKVLANLRKIMEKITGRFVLICHYDTTEIRLVMFEDYGRMREVFDKINDALKSILTNQKKQLLPNQTSAHILMLTLGDFNELREEELKV